MKELIERLREEMSSDWPCVHFKQGMTNNSNDCPYCKIERLTAELAEVKASDKRNFGKWIEVCLERDRLAADAARYRFWRNRYPTTFAPPDMTPEDVDRATDRAIQGELK